MIFLAVTLGFFAETIRENITEHRRAREFARSMLADLEEDTAQLRSYREYFAYCASNIDTLQQLLARDDPRSIASGKLYWYGLFGGAHRYFVPNDETLQQMKSSGSLRYFKTRVAAAVARCDRYCRILESNEQLQQSIYTEVRKSRAQIFDFRYNDVANTIYLENRGKNFDYRRIDSFTKTKPPLLSYDKTLLNQYLELVRSRFMRISNVGIADSLLRQASVLIGDLKTEYKLGNE